MKTFKKRQDQQKSKKAHIPDPAKNDHFHEQDTPTEKSHKNKVPHGKFYGKRWFPENK